MSYLLLLPSVVASPGGIQRYSVDLVQALQRLGVECEVVTLNDRPETRVPGAARVGIWGCGGARLRAITKLRFGLTAIWRCVRRRPRRVVCGHANFLGIAVCLRLFLGLRYIQVAYGVEVWQRPGAVRRFGLRLADGIWTISRFTRTRLVEAAGVPDDRVTLLPNTVDGERFRPSPRDAQLSQRYDLDGSRVLLTVGRLNLSERDKGFEVVLAALRRLRQTFPVIRYIVVGVGEYQPLLERRAVELGVRDLVIFASKVTDEELPRYYSLCDVFVMPSKKEGFGFVFLEALASGKPVVAGNRDGSRDPLLDGDLGLLVDPDDPDAVAEAIRAILTKEAPEEVRDGARLRSLVLKHYGATAFDGRLAACLRRAGHL